MRQIVGELAQQLDERYSDQRAGGVGDEAARREAIAELDDADRLRELTGIGPPPAAEPLALGADTRGLLGGIWQDVRFGARLLVKNRAASLVVIFTLALAIAANAIVFGFADLRSCARCRWATPRTSVTIFGVDRRTGSNRERVSIADYLRSHVRRRRSWTWRLIGGTTHR